VVMAMVMAMVIRGLFGYSIDLIMKVMLYFNIDFLGEESHQ
jgi:hypothetical protein